MDNSTQLCLPSAGQEDDWKNLYESSFPVDERMPVGEIRQMLQRGAILLHKTLNKSNELLCFSLTFSAPSSDFLLLSYIATDPTKRSGGFGSKHMRRLIEILKALYPNHMGLFLEIESTKETGLDAATQKARVRRLDFYQRLGAKRLCKKYLLPSMVAGTPPRQGELLWFEFGVKLIDDPVLAKVIAEIYEKAYNLPAGDPLAQSVLSQFAGATTGAPPTTCPVTPGAASGTGGGAAPAPLDGAVQQASGQNSSFAAQENPDLPGAKQSEPGETK